MRVLVTGGSGKLGRWVLRELVLHGHEAVSADRVRPDLGDVPESETEGRVPFRRVDVGDVGHVAGALAGCDAVVHLAAIPAPYGDPDEVVFGGNTRATFAVLHAAGLLGVRRAVVASSISALGMAWARPPFHALYAPVDEAHPLLGKDPYALSKEVDERTCEMFHRRDGLAVAAMRFHWIMAPEEAAGHARDVQAHPESQTHLQWGYVDVRDAARACRLALEAEGLGFEPFNITAADTLLDIPTEEALHRYSPETELRSPIEGTASAWSTEKARRMLGYTPAHSWRDERAS